MRKLELVRSVKTVWKDLQKTELQNENLYTEIYRLTRENMLILQKLLFE